MFFFLPVSFVALFYILAALLPAVLLLRYIYRHDTVEKEPAGLLCSLLALGVVSALCARLLERLGQRLLSLFTAPGSPSYIILLSFLVVALAEESLKFFFLRRRTWNNPNFNYRFDAIVYAVFISLGFAAWENIQYVLHYGLSVALPRAVLAVPGHLSFAVFMGLFYGRAKLAEARGNAFARSINLGYALVTAVLLHGFYDACAMIGTTRSAVLFVGFVLLMFLTVFRLVRRESAGDLPI